MADDGADAPVNVSYERVRTTSAIQLQMEISIPDTVILQLNCLNDPNKLEKHLVSQAHDDLP